MSRRRKPVKQQQRAWDPLTQRVVNVDLFVQHGIDPPQESWANNLYSVAVRHIGHGALHLSFHRHDRAAVRDWRHFQAIKNEVAGPERLAVEVFPPESLLTDAANEYHLWVFPENWERDFPFLLPVSNVLTRAEGELLFGKSKWRQRDWQPGVPTGKGLVLTTVEGEKL